MMKMYYDEIAAKIFTKNQELEQEGILNEGFVQVVEDQGVKKAEYLFNIDEDFQMDLVSSYNKIKK